LTLFVVSDPSVVPGVGQNDSDWVNLVKVTGIEVVGVDRMMIVVQREVDRVSYLDDLVEVVDDVGCMNQVVDGIVGWDLGSGCGWVGIKPEIEEVVLREYVEVVVHKVVVVEVD
jgi:hypothetical protein